ncbi:MAG TPA: hypothetical protein VKE51_35760 [Vicinamibacterales bacterium]|nr:hypothetical protein [Vicinamibacterales bacterium]
MPRSLALSLAAATLIGCSSTPEQPLLQQFFAASRLRDNTTLAGFAAAAFEPGTDGIVTTFSITNVTPERRKPLTLKTLARAHEDAKAEDLEFTKRKDAYQAENLDAIKRVIAAGQVDAKIPPNDAAVQAAWNKFLEDGVVVARRVGDTRRRLASESMVVDMSINGGPTRVDVTKYDGALVSKDVSISAPVRMPSGQTAQKNFVVTMQRAILRADQEMTGRWIITIIRDASGPPSTPRS